MRKVLAFSVLVLMTITACTSGGDTLAAELRKSLSPEEIAELEEGLAEDRRASESEGPPGADNWTPTAQLACELADDLHAMSTVSNAPITREFVDYLEFLKTEAEAEGNEPLYYHLDRLWNAVMDETGEHDLWSTNYAFDFQRWCEKTEGQYYLANPTTTTTTVPPTTTTTMSEWEKYQQAQDKAQAEADQIPVCSDTEDIVLSETTEIEITAQKNCWSGWIRLEVPEDYYGYYKWSITSENGATIDIEFSDGTVIRDIPGDDEVTVSLEDAPTFRIRGVGEPSKVIIKFDNHTRDK